MIVSMIVLEKLSGLSGAAPNTRKHLFLFESVHHCQNVFTDTR